MENRDTLKYLELEMMLLETLQEIKLLKTTKTK